MGDVYGSMAAAMPPLSHLECTVCHRQQRVGNVASKMANGWPACCGYTMRLVTMREVADGACPFDGGHR